MQLLLFFCFVLLFYIIVKSQKSDTQLRMLHGWFSSVHSCSIFTHIHAQILEDFFQILQYYCILLQ